MQVVDTRYAVETPEGIDLEYIPANFIPRGFAFLIDLLIRIAFIIVIAIAFSIAFPSGANQAFLLIGYFLIDWFYPIFFEIGPRQGTPGKWAMKLKVIHVDGTAVNFSSSFLRNTLRVLDGQPVLFYAVGIFTTLTNNKNQRLGDLAANTVVVYQDPKKRKIADNNLETLIPPASIPRDLLPWIVALDERSDQLSQSRLAELCGLLAPHFSGQSNQFIASQINPMANYIRGQR